MQIKIAQDFTTAPGPRYVTEGKFSGEEFRTTILLPKLRDALAKKCRLTVDLDGSSGYGTSFLEESFGGLIRNDGILRSQLKETLHFISNEEPSLVEEIETYINQAHSESIKRK